MLTGSARSPTATGGGSTAEEQAPRGKRVKIACDDVHSVVDDFPGWLQRNPRQRNRTHLHRVPETGRGAFNNGRIAALEGLGNSGIVYGKPLWRAAGGHSMENAGYDVSFVNRLRDHGARVTSAAPPPSEVSWFFG